MADRLRRLTLLFFFAFCSIGLGQWVDSHRVGDTQYFFFESPQRVERFDLESEQWLTTLSLPSARGIPTAGTADADGIYVSYGKAVYRYDLSGQSETHLLNASYSVSALHTTDDILFVNYSSGLYARFTSIAKASNTIVDTFENYVDSVHGSSIALGIGKIFGRSAGVSPSDITFITFDEQGDLLSGGGSPHHGSYPSASQTWVFPDEARVVDSSGTVYNTSNLQYTGTLGSSFVDVAFVADEQPIVLRGGTLAAYTKTLLPAGQFTLESVANGIAVNDTTVFAFSPSSTESTGIGVELVPLDSFDLPTPGEPVNPLGQPYTPKSVFMDAEGVIYLFAPVLQSIFRWDPTTQVYLETLPLVGVPEFAAISQKNNTIYTGYADGLIQQIDLEAETPQETPFATLPQNMLGLSTAGPYVFAVDPSGAWVSHYTFGEDGVLIDSEEWNYRSSEYVWSEPNQKMYFFRDDTSPNDLLWEEINENGTAYEGVPAGGIGFKKDSPDHSSTGITHPIRVSPSGDIVVLGSGRIYNAESLSRLSTELGNPVADIAFLGSDIHTVREINGITQLQTWSGASYGESDVFQLPGAPLGLLAVDSDTLLSVNLGEDGIPSFFALNGDLEIAAPPTLAAPSKLTGQLDSATSLTLAWALVAGANEYTVERKNGADGEWVELGSTLDFDTDYVDSSVSSPNTFYYRVTAKNGELASDPSDEVEVRISAPAPPADLAGVSEASDRIALSWSAVDLADTYTIDYRSVNSTVWFNVLTFSNGETSYLHRSLSADAEYLYRISASNVIGQSESVEIMVRTLPTPPVKPTVYTASATTSSVSLSWYVTSSFVGNYVLEKRIGSDGEWIEIYNDAATSFQDFDVAPGQSLFYRVKSRNSLGDSTYSAERAVEVPELVPTTLYLHDSLYRAAVVKWTRGAAESFVLERKLVGEPDWKVIYSGFGEETSGILSSEYAEFPESLADPTGTTGSGQGQSGSSGSTSSTGSSSSSGSSFGIEYIYESVELGSSEAEDIPVSNPYSSYRRMYFTDLDVVPGESYEYRLKGVYYKGFESPFSFLDVEILPVPTPYLKAISADWDRVSFDIPLYDERSSYVIERSPSGEDNWAVISPEREDSPYWALPDYREYRFTDLTVSWNTAYQYRAKVVRDEVTTDYSPVVEISSLERPIPEPSALLQVSPAEGISHDLFWGDSLTETEYKLMRWSEVTGWELIASLPQDSVSYTDEDLTLGTSYRYALFLLNETGTSPAYQSDPITAQRYQCVFQEDFEGESGSDPAYRSIGGSRLESDGGGNSFLWFGGTPKREFKSLTTIPEGEVIIKMRYKASFTLDETLPPMLPDETVESIEPLGELTVGSFDPIEVNSLHGSVPSAGTGASFYTGSDYYYYLSQESKLTDPVSNGLPSDGGGSSYPILHSELRGAAEWRTFTFRAYSFGGSEVLVIAQNDVSGLNLDTWAIDDICVLAPAPAIPDRPEALLVTAASDVSSVLTWRADSAVDTFLIERKAPGQDWEPIRTIYVNDSFLGVPSYYYEDNDLSPSTRYAYRVSSVNSSGVSEPSSVAFVTTMAPFADQWLTENAELLPSQSLRSLGAHKDSDGMTFLEKFAYGLPVGVKSDLVDLDSLTPGAPKIWFDPTVNRLCAEFPRRKGAPVVSYIVEVSSDLKVWTPLSNECETVSLGDDWELVCYQDTETPDSKKIHHIRIRIVPVE